MKFASVSFGKAVFHRPHRVFDVTFRDDDSRVRKDHAAKNSAVINHAAMKLLSRAKGRMDRSAPVPDPLRMMFMWFRCAFTMVLLICCAFSHIIQ
ncbi:hypothetical protein [Paracoccus sp. (in: a-proteobacteria)]|uniref:hypothetical protein n=1 Tax=Paracoccus sp. TaxID=267 RepID=UPI003A85C183